MRARKKPVEVEVYRIGSRQTLPDWLILAVKNGVIFECIIPAEGFGIRTLEGIMHAYEGDYIIQGVMGEIYSCKQDIFEKTYEIIQEDIV